VIFFFSKDSRFFFQASCFCNFGRRFHFSIFPVGFVRQACSERFSFPFPFHPGPYLMLRDACFFFLPAYWRFSRRGCIFFFRCFFFVPPGRTSYLPVYVLAPSVAPPPSHSPSPHPPSPLSRQPKGFSKTLRRVALFPPQAPLPAGELGCPVSERMISVLRRNDHFLSHHLTVVFSRLSPGLTPHPRFFFFEWSPCACSLVAFSGEGFFFSTLHL